VDSMSHPDSLQILQNNSQVWLKREVPVVLATYQKYEDLQKIYSISIVEINEVVSQEFMEKVFLGEVPITTEQYVAIYARLEYEQTGRMSYYYFFVTECDIERIPIMMIRMTQKRDGIQYVREQKEEIVIAPMVRTVDRSQPETYSDYAHEYVQESYDRRVTDLVRILRPFVAVYKIERFIAPNDGAGVVDCASREIGVQCLSSDPSPQMVQEAELKGNKVKLKKARESLKEDGVFVISHSETLDPGLVVAILKEKKKVIVYEMTEIYAGYSLLVQNMPGVRSTYSLKIPLELSVYGPQLRSSSWYKIIKYGASFYVSDWRCVQHLRVAHTLGYNVSVSTSDPKVYEKCKEYGFRMHTYAMKDVGLYYDKVDKYCHIYFSLREGRFHGSLNYFDVWKQYSYVYALDSQYKITLGCHTYGRIEGRREGEDENGQTVLLSSLCPRLSNLRSTIREFSDVEKWHISSMNGVVEGIVLPEYAVKRRGRISSKVEYWPYYCRPEILKDYDIDGTWQKDDSYLFRGFKYKFRENKFFLDGEEVTKQILALYPKRRKIVTFYLEGKISEESNVGPYEKKDVGHEDKYEYSEYGDYLLEYYKEDVGKIRQNRSYMGRDARVGVRDKEHSFHYYIIGRR